MFLPSLSDLATQFCTQREGAIFLDEPFILRGSAAKTSLTSKLGFTQSLWPMWQMSTMPAATQSAFSRWKTQHKALVFRQIPETTLVVQWGFAVDRSAFYGTAATMNGGAFQSLLLCSAAGCRKVRQGYRRPCKTSHNHARPCDVSQPGHSASIGRDRASAPHWGHYLVTSGRQCKALLENLWQDQCRPS